MRCIDCKHCVVMVKSNDRGVGWKYLCIVAHTLLDNINPEKEIKCEYWRSSIYENIHDNRLKKIGSGRQSND